MSGDDDPNKPPSIGIAPVQAASVASPLTLTALVTDDGLPKPRPLPKTPPTGQINTTVGSQPRGLTISWMQYRGPAKVVFEPAGRMAVKDGQAVTKAHFAAPGTYILRATANDGALSTKTDLTVTVSEPRP